jgi:hypothetical protein
MSTGEREKATKILAPNNILACVIADWRRIDHPTGTKDITQNHLRFCFTKMSLSLSNMKLVALLGILAPLFRSIGVVTSLSAVAPRSDNKILVLVEPSPLTYGKCDL